MSTQTLGRPPNDHQMAAQPTLTLCRLAGYVLKLSSSPSSCPCPYPSRPREASPGYTVIPRSSPSLSPSQNHKSHLAPTHCASPDHRKLLIHCLLNSLTTSSSGSTLSTPPRLSQHLDIANTTFYNGHITISTSGALIPDACLGCPNGGSVPCHNRSLGTQWRHSPLGCNQQPLGCIPRHGPCCQSQQGPWHSVSNMRPHGQRGLGYPRPLLRILRNSLRQHQLQPLGLSEHGYFTRCRGSHQRPTRSATPSFENLLSNS